MRTLIVSRISIESYNRLVDLGYSVQIVQVAKNGSPLINYSYQRPINPNQPSSSKSISSHVVACKACHVLNNA